MMSILVMGGTNFVSSSLANYMEFSWFNKFK